MFQIQCSDESRKFWCMLPSFHKVEFQTLEEARKSAISHDVTIGTFDPGKQVNTTRNIRILDLETLEVHRVIEERSSLKGCDKCGGSGTVHPAAANASKSPPAWQKGLIANEQDRMEKQITELQIKLACGTVD